MSENGSKSFLIVSDIHACDDDPSSSSTASYVSSMRGASYGHKDPFAELEQLVTAASLKPDYLLCPGDITNKSNSNAFTYAWQRLDNLAKKIGAKLVATVGNHDVDSRYTSNKLDPCGFAKTLEPSIPFADRQHYLEFWAENFTLIQEDGCNILAVNTAAFHGIGDDAKSELQHGRISEYTNLLIEEQLNNAQEVAVNIALCHHHAVKEAQGDLNLLGHTRGADRLVQILDASPKPWLIVHGHIHSSDIYNAPGGFNAPTILACASFSAQVNADAQNKHPNQVHYLVVEPSAAAGLSMQNAGTVRSWTWLPGVGWSPSKGKPGLGHLAGFGHRTNISTLCNQVETLISTSGSDYIQWHQALTGVPQLKYLLPIDFEKFEKHLSQMSISLLRDGDGAIAQVTKS